MLPCYDCKNRRNIPGDCHFACIANWKSMRMPPGDPHGIRNGWYLFPFNFDPTWGPDECQQFDSKGDQQDDSQEQV